MLPAQYAFPTLPWCRYSDTFHEDPSRQPIGHRGHYHPYHSYNRLAALPDLVTANADGAAATLARLQEAELLIARQSKALMALSDGVIVKGFKVINSGYGTLEDPCGIKVYNRKNVVIQNNILDNNFFGIYIPFLKRITIIIE